MFYYQTKCSVTRHGLRVLAHKESTCCDQSCISSLNTAFEWGVMVKDELQIQIKKKTGLPLNTFKTLWLYSLGSFTQVFTQQTNRPALPHGCFRLPHMSPAACGHLCECRSHTTHVRFQQIETDDPSVSQTHIAVLRRLSIYVQSACGGFLCLSFSVPTFPRMPVGSQWGTSWLQVEEL